MKLHSIFLLLLLIAYSCNSVSKPTEPVAEHNEIDMTAYNALLYENRSLISDWAYAQKDYEEDETRALKIESVEYYAELKERFLPAAHRFVKDLNLSKTEIEDMLEIKINTFEEYEDAIVGILLFISASNCSLSADKLPTLTTRGKSFKDCFIEATGIATGIALVGCMAKETITKAAVEATLKLVTKIGTRTLNGVGLALLAAEIIWCMW